PIYLVRCLRTSTATTFTASLRRSLKRNFVVVRLGCGAGFRRRSRFTRTGFSSGFGAFSWSAARAGRTTAEQLHRFADHAQFTPLLPALFIVPRIQLETAFDKNR